MLYARPAVWDPLKIIPVLQFLCHCEGTMVRADAVDFACGKRFPQRLTVRSLPQRRGHHKLCGIFSRVTSLCQKQILRAGFKIHLLTARSRAPRFRKALRRRKMHHVNGGFRKFCNAHETRHSFRLHRRGAGKRMPGRAGQAPGFHFLNAAVQDIPVFAMDADQRTLILCRLERCVDCAVVHAQGIIDHVKLVGDRAAARHFGKLCCGFIVPFGNRHVKPVIAGAAACLFLPGVERLHKRAAAVLRGKIKHRRCTPKNGGTAAGDEIIRRSGTAGVKVEMRMRIDEAGKQEAAFRIDAHSVRTGEPFAHSGNAPVVHEHIRARTSVRVYHTAVLNEKIHFTQSSKDHESMRNRMTKAPSAAAKTHAQTKALIAGPLGGP